jgi:hypothetical protein
MSVLNRISIYLLLLVLLGVGIRLMYYGLETVVGASPHYAWSDVLVLLAGVVIFIAGIVAGVLLPGLRESAHN